MSKKIATLLLAALFIVSGTSAFARGMGRGAGDGDGDCRGGMFGRAADELNLTEVQQEKIFKINQEYRQKFYDSRKDPIKLADLRAEHFKAVYAVLTSEQKEKFISSERGGFGPGMGGGCW